METICYYCFYRLQTETITTDVTEAVPCSFITDTLSFLEFLLILAITHEPKVTVSNFTLNVRRIASCGIPTLTSAV